MAEKLQSSKTRSMWLAYVIQSSSGSSVRERQLKHFRSPEDRENQDSFVESKIRNSPGMDEKFELFIFSRP